MKKVLGFMITLMIGMVVTMVLAGMTVASKLYQIGRQQVSNSYKRGALCVKVSKQATKTCASSIQTSVSFMIMMMWHRFKTCIKSVSMKTSSATQAVTNSVQQAQVQVKQQATNYSNQLKLEIKEMFKLKNVVTMTTIFVLGFVLSRVSFQPQIQPVGSASTSFPAVLESSQSFDGQGLEQALENLNAVEEVIEEILTEDVNASESTEIVETEEVIVSPKPEVKPAVKPEVNPTVSEPTVSKPVQPESKPVQPESKPSYEGPIKEEVSIDVLPEVQVPVETPEIQEEIIVPPTEPIILEGEVVVGDLIINDSLLGEVIPEGGTLLPY